MRNERVIGNNVEIHSLTGSIDRSITHPLTFLDNSAFRGNGSVDRRKMGQFESPSLMFCI